MPATWLVVLSWCAIAFACAGWILVDIYRRGYRQRMTIMGAVWPVTALYLGPVAVLGYRRYGRPMSARWLAEHARDEPPDKPAGPPPPPVWVVCGRSAREAISGLAWAEIDGSRPAEL